MPNKKELIDEIKNELIKITNGDSNSECINENINSLYLKVVKLKEYYENKKKVNLTNTENLNNKEYCKDNVIIISEYDINHKITNAPIYLIKETNEYCFKINNKLFIGNIGNIVNKQNGNKIKKCNRLYCNNTFFNKKQCKFYHDKIDVRNFPKYSWTPINKINNYDIENSRFIGSVSTLSEDILKSTDYEKKLRNKQLVHDFLLYNILDNYLK